MISVILCLKAPMLRQLASVAVLYLIGLGAAAQFTKIAVMFPSVTKVYADAGATAVFILSLLALFGAIFGLVMGRLIAGVSPKTILLYSLAISAVLSLLQAATPQFPVMLALRAIEGGAHLAIVVAAPALLASSTSSGLLPAAMTLWTTVVAAAFAITAFLGDDVSLPGMLVRHGILMLGLLPLAAILLKDTEPSVETSRTGGRSFFGMHIDAYRKASVAIPAVAFLAYTSCYMSGLTLLSSYTDQLTLAGLLPSFGIAVSLTLVVATLHRVQPSIVLKLGLALAALSAIVLSWAPSSIVPWFLLYGALPFVQVASFAAVPQMTSSHADRSLAYGAIAQAGNFGNLLGPPLMLAATQHAGPAGGALFVVAVLFAALLFQMTRGRTLTIGP